VILRYIERELKEVEFPHKIKLERKKKSQTLKGIGNLETVELKKNGSKFKDEIRR